MQRARHGGGRKFTISSSESEVYSEYTIRIDQLMKFESSEYDGDENEADLCEGKAGGLNENESEVSGGSSEKDRS